MKLYFSLGCQPFYNLHKKIRLHVAKCLRCFFGTTFQNSAIFLWENHKNNVCHCIKAVVSNSVAQGPKLKAHFRSRTKQDKYFLNTLKQWVFLNINTNKNRQ